MKERHICTWMRLKFIIARKSSPEAGGVLAEVERQRLDRVMEKLCDDGVRRMEVDAMRECRRLYEGSLFDWNDMWVLTDMRRYVWREIEPDIPFWMRFRLCVGEGVWNELAETARKLNWTAGHGE